MIANITQGSFLKPLLEYNEKKIGKGEASCLVVENVIDENYKQGVFMIANLGTQSKRKDKFFHVSLNFTQEDKPKITDEILKNIASDYLKELGFDNDHPYIVYKHEDTLHPHIHIVTSKILKNKKVIPDNNLRYKSQATTRLLEEKYKLTPVNSYKEKNNIVIVKNEPQAKNLRGKLNFHLKFALQNYKVQNFTELQEYLNKYQLNVTEIKGVNETKKKLIPYTGIIFNDLGNSFKQSQKGIKASALYLKPTTQNLDKIFNRNKESHKAKRKQIQSQIGFVVGMYKTISLEKLEEKLKLKDIQFAYKKDSNNNLVGVSFTDRKTGYKYSGESIGQNYKAKSLREIISNETVFKPQIITQLNFNKYKTKIADYSVNQQINTLTALGFKIQQQNGNLYISDYKNKGIDGYILFKESNINQSSIDLYKNSKKIDFNQLNKINQLHFEYNRASIINDDEKGFKILEEIDKEMNPNQSNTNFEEKSKVLENYLEELYQDTIIYQDNNVSDHQEKKADIDKKKGPIRRRRKL